MKYERSFAELYINRGGKTRSFWKLKSNEFNF
jgi:hypothetical protein